MSELTQTYSVVLKADLPSRERELLEHLCCKITSSDGGVLLHFQCTKIDVSHHFYIQMETFKPGDKITHPVKIPHHYVFLISGDESRPPIGFLGHGT